MEEEFVSLENIAEGAAIERFRDELKLILGNILDPNTDPKKIREINLKLTVKPDIDRQVAGVTLSVTSKLAPTKGVDTRIYIGNNFGVPVATEHNPKQNRLNFEAKGDITNIKEVSPNAQ